MLYSKKQRWKLLLVFLALLIVAGSLWFTNSIVETIKEDERQKALLWSVAIQNRAQLVSYTSQLFETLREEERKKVNLWLKAIVTLSSDKELEDYTLVIEVLESNTTVPIVVLDSKGKLITHRNVDETLLADKEKLDSLVKSMESRFEPIVFNIYKSQKQRLYYTDSKIVTELETTLDNLINSFISETVINAASVPVILTDSTQKQILRWGNIDSVTVQSAELMKAQLEKLRLQNEPIRIDLGEEGGVSYAFYSNSKTLNQLQYFPVVQFTFVGIFLVLSYLIFSTFRKAEQDQVWAGLAKETAHQLGTPLSSLLAWIEILKANNTDPEIVNELTKDAERLNTITERFSKIGSKPELKPHLIHIPFENSIQYLGPRISKKVELRLQNFDENQKEVLISPPLFEWVIENLTKNAIDAMSGEGTVTYEIIELEKYYQIDVWDTGKGIPSNKLKTVFEPGFTTKKRGWGLGLSLVKRIVEDYHKGKISALSIPTRKGATFRILLKKQ
ncbi:MAG: sensor histidine kinase [Luteibaculaceae bacterium]